MEGHEAWLRRIDAELDGELTLVEGAALARHLAACVSCSGARASHLELRAAIARSAGEPHAHTVPRPRIGGRTVAVLVVVGALAGAALGWAAHLRWGGPGTTGSLEESRAALVVR